VPHSHPEGGGFTAGAGSISPRIYPSRWRIRRTTGRKKEKNCTLLLLFLKNIQLNPIDKMGELVMYAKKGSAANPMAEAGK
jgi:hypothetical protein